MKRRTIALSVGALLLVISITVSMLLYNSDIEVNNTRSAKELVTRKYGLEKELLAKAIFYVRRGFEEVNARDLAEEVGMKLECKRQISDTQFYYVIVGDYQCFFIVDEEDIVQEVLTIRDFPTIEQTKEWLNQDNQEYRNKTELRFKQYYQTFKKQFDDVPKELKQQIIVGMRNRFFGEGMFMESVTFNDWIDHIMKLEV